MICQEVHGGVLEGQPSARTLLGVGNVCLTIPSTLAPALFSSHVDRNSRTTYSADAGMSPYVWTAPSYHDTAHRS